MQDALVEISHHEATYVLDCRGGQLQNQTCQSHPRVLFRTCSRYVLLQSTPKVLREPASLVRL
jgi:hypothetical protein